MLSVVNVENDENISHPKHFTKLDGLNKKKGLNVIDVNKVKAEVRNEEPDKTDNSFFTSECESELYLPPSEDGKVLLFSFMF